MLTLSPTKRIALAAATLAVAALTTASTAFASSTAAPTASAPDNTPITSAPTEPNIQPALPQIGDCFNLTTEQTNAATWPGFDAVSCYSPHTVEVYSSGIVPPTAAGNVAQVTAFLRDKCANTDGWAYAGANRVVDGVVSNPLRIDNVYFAVDSGDGQGYVCGVSVANFDSPRPTQVTTLRKPLAKIVDSDPSSLQFCSLGSEQDQFDSKWRTVTCSKARVWKAVKWVTLGKATSNYPSQAAIANRMIDKCGPTASYTYPTARDWKNGLTQGWCFQYFPSGPSR